jgi:hypothetical protein
MQFYPLFKQLIFNNEAQHPKKLYLSHTGTFTCTIPGKSLLFVWFYCIGNGTSKCTWVTQRKRNFAFISRSGSSAIFLGVIQIILFYSSGLFIFINISGWLSHVQNQLELIQHNLSSIIVEDLKHFVQY